MYGMMTRGQKLGPRETLRQNLRYLMDRHGWTERETAKRAGVHQKTINKALNMYGDPTINTVDKIGGAFGLKGWQLLIQNLPELYQSLSDESEIEKTSIILAGKEGKFKLEKK